MINYMVGKITHINSKFIILESNWTGYYVYVSNPNEYELNKNKKVYISEFLKINNKNIITKEFYGFLDLESKILFNSLQTVPNIGPKTAINILQTSSKILIQLIETNNWEELAKLPNLNPNLAKSICVSLANGYLYKSKEKIKLTGSNKSDYSISELNSALAKLGYDKEDINYCLNEYQKNNSLDHEKEISDVLSDCIKLIIEKQQILKNEL